MPLSKNIDSYPPAIRDVARNLRNLNEGKEITLPTKGLAIRTRQLFYGYAGALEEWIRNNPGKPQVEEFRGLAAGIRQTEIKLRDETLIFTPRWNTASHKALEELNALLVAEQPQPLDLLDKKIEEKEGSYADDVLRKLGYGPSAAARPAECDPPISIEPDTVSVEPEVNTAYKQFMNRGDNN